MMVVYNLRTAYSLILRKRTPIFELLVSNQLGNSIKLYTFNEIFIQLEDIKFQDANNKYTLQTLTYTFPKDRPIEYIL